VAPAFCHPGFYCATPASEAACPAGRYCDNGTVTPASCPKGYWCPEGSTSATRRLCPAYSTTVGVGASALTDCVCDAGWAVDAATGICKLCPVDSYCAAGAATPCPGRRCSLAGASLESQCSCPAHASWTAAGGCLCDDGYYADASASTPAHPLLCGFQCVACPAGRICVGGGQAECGAGYSCPPGSADRLPCAAGSYCPGDGSSRLCPDNSRSPPSSSACTCDAYAEPGPGPTCGTCRPGGVKLEAGNHACAACTPGFSCVKGHIIPCPAGTNSTASAAFCRPPPGQLVVLTYAVAVRVALPVTRAQFNRTDFVLVTSAAAGCGGCAGPELDPAICGRCRIGLVVTDAARRRLLAASNISTSNISVAVNITVDTSPEATVVADNLANASALEAALSVGSVPGAVVESAPALTASARSLGACPVGSYCPGDGVAYRCEPGGFGI
jgi:hypothetical protein